MPMKHRIRSAAIIVKDNAVLLVKHKNPENGFEWWVPPGGGLEDDESIYDCAKRETYEETGLKVELGQILYLREFAESSRAIHQFEIFILANSFTGELTTANVRPQDLDSAYIKDVQFLSKRQMRGLTVFPEILKDKFWQDFSPGKRLEVQYLGLQKVYSLKGE
jgi:ADP-ribose pyrophosphatase YjhB (NUDIX family)